MRSRWHCKRGQRLCPECRARRALYERRRSKRQALGYPTGLLPAIGYTRRLRALVRIGYSLSRLAVEVGTSRNVIRRIITGRSQRIERHLAERIQAAYDRLWCRPLEGTQSSTRATNYALAQRWHSPLAWDDDTIDDPAAKPEGIRRAA